MKQSAITKTLLWLFLASLVLGAALQAISGVGQFLVGWFAGSLLLITAALAIWFAWQSFGSSRQLAWLLAATFALRLVVGVGMEHLLPLAGYDEPSQQAGYLAKDAYNRDTQAWQLGHSARPLFAAFSSEYPTDQYGGLLAISALVYRSLTPDAHRPYLILILTSLAAALGVGFFYHAVRLRWDNRVALLGAWIVAVYPESVFWGASQMREPFLIAFIAVGLWAVFAFSQRQVVGMITLAVSLAGLFFFSSVVALAVAGALAVLTWLEFLPEGDKLLWHIAGWAAVLLGAAALVAITGDWLRASASYDITLTEQSSGWVQKLVSQLGRPWLGPLVTVYGVTRPMLPAALLETSAWLARVLSIWRSLGWYALLPLLIYGSFTLWQVLQARDRRVLAWLAVVSWIWILVSSARGGGDASDNPRYRVIFLVFMAVLAAWAYVWAQRRKDAWLGRVLAIEGIFLVFITQWYAARYYMILTAIPFGLMLALIGLLSAGVVAIGWLTDQRKKKFSVMK